MHTKNIIQDIVSYFISQYIKEVISESRNEKATYAKTPLKLKDGMSIHLLVKPEKLKAIILKSLMISVTKYKTTADDTHLKRPNVTRFNGSKSKLITGFARKNTPVSAIPEIRSV